MMLRSVPHSPPARKKARMACQATADLNKGLGELTGPEDVLDLGLEI